MPEAAIASASRSAAFLVTTSRRRERLGLQRASRTACSPNSQIASAPARRARSFPIAQAGFLLTAPPPAAPMARPPHACKHRPRPRPGADGCFEVDASAPLP